MLEFQIRYIFLIHNMSNNSTSRDMLKKTSYRISTKNLIKSQTKITFYVEASSKSRKKTQTLNTLTTLRAKFFLKTKPEFSL